MLCLDPSKIQPRQITLSLGNRESGDAVGEVSITTSGVVGRVKWTYKTTTVHISIYDEKTGLYRIQERPLSKPKARSVRLDNIAKRAITFSRLVLTITTNLDSLKATFLDKTLKLRTSIAIGTASNLHSVSILELS